MSQPSRPATRPEEQPDASGARLAFSWALVSVPLAYGLYETIVKVSDLFTG